MSDRLCSPVLATSFPLPQDGRLTSGIWVQGAWPGYVCEYREWYDLETALQWLCRRAPLWAAQQHHPWGCYVLLQGNTLLWSRRHGRCPYCEKEHAGPREMV